MIRRIKNMLKGKKIIFYDLCRSNNLTLSYQDNETEMEKLKEIFVDREYSDFFPFYKKVTIVDIGAHFGYFSIFAKYNVDDASRIIAVEPSKTNFRHLEKNISDCNIGNITCYNYAIGGENGRSRLYLGKNPNHSIIENYPLGDNNKKSEEVEVRTLEELFNESGLKEIDFLKIDCEGAEYEIFKSTTDSVFNRIGTISMEFHDLKDRNFTADDLISKLTANKFKIVKFQYGETSMNLNYGKIIGTKEFG